MLTTEQAKEYLETVGVRLPGFILDGLIEQVNSVQACLDANYQPGAATLIQCYVLALMALGQGDRYISSQTAPSGAARSFRYQSFADRWKGLLSLLRGLDKYGCATDLIPPDPTQTTHAGLWVAKGGCYQGG